MPRPTAPTKSKPPVAIAGVAGTRRQISTPMSTLSTAQPQNSTRQLVFWVTAAEIGRPSAPPMPRVALMSAIDEPSFCGGTSSRSALIPSGTMPIPSPCRPRPITMGASDVASAQVIEPITSGTEQKSSIRRLPSRSPSRPVTGVATAPTNSVMVTTHDAFDAVVSRMRGRSPMSGTTKVCMSAATMPATASTVTMPPERVAGAELSTRVSQLLDQWISLRKVVAAYNQVVSCNQVASRKIPVRSDMSDSGGHNGRASRHRCGFARGPVWTSPRT